MIRFKGKGKRYKAQGLKGKRGNEDYGLGGKNKELKADRNEAGTPGC